MKTLTLSAPYPQQEAFMRCRARRIAYGGARGGGKSWAARAKAALLALNYDGIQILIVRRTYVELEENHIMPLLSLLKGIAAYRDAKKEFLFPNGSRIKLGHCEHEKDIVRYQGQSYDAIFLEEATHFTELQYTAFTECSRPSGLCSAAFSPRIYFTCNPGGVGHAWVKRLFIDKRYSRSERAEDYAFFPAKVYDNKFVMDNDPDYVRSLESIPDEARRRAYLDGDWDIFIGQYFTEFKRDIHVIKPFALPAHWRRYAALDYGLDMLACCWIAVDDHENAYVYRELYRDNLIVSAAANEIKRLTDEPIYIYYAPPDLWNRHSDIGKSTAELMSEEGITLYKASNDRVQGWYNLHEWLKPYTDERGELSAHLRIFENCVNLIRTLPELQFDEKNPNDCAREPHELTHAPDALRYFVSGRPLPAPKQAARDEEHIDYDEETNEVLNYGR